MSKLKREREREIGIDIPPRTSDSVKKSDSVIEESDGYRESAKR